MSAGKLATIVAVDVAGYAARAEADEAAAVDAVARLVKRCGRVAKAHGGRIFNTAGDAVMMEYPSVAAALEAADELARNPDPPIRVGVHLGEVRPMPSGDLLGIGVSVASRLQALAPAGGVIVSGEARRALRGPMAERLASKGEVTLDKVDESVAIYELTQDAAAVARTDLALRAKRSARRTALIGAAALAAAVVVVLAWPFLRPAPETRVAVFSLTAPDADSTLQTLSAGLANDVALALGAANVEPVARGDSAAVTREQRVSRAQALGAALVLDGAAERVGSDLRLTIAVVRARDGATLWSDAFDAPAGKVSALRLRAAERSADVLSCGAQVVRKRRAEMAAETFSLLLRGCAAAREQTSAPEAREALAQVVEREPRFAFARSLLALSSAMASQDAPEPQAALLREEARAQAERALRADPRIGESYIALSLLERRANWAARENLLRQGLDRDEFNAALNTRYSNLLADIGRVSEALTFGQRGSARAPLSRSKRRNIAHLMLLGGDAQGAREIVDTMAFGYPDDELHWHARMRAALWGGRYEDAIALLDAPASPARAARPRACWRLAAEAVRAAIASPQTAARLRQCQRDDDLPASQAMLLLAALGDLDGSFAVAQALFVDQHQDGHDILFSPAAAAMRADPRFMPLMRDLGLLRYWRLNGGWPDFCNDPGLPYQCRAEAIRLT